MARPFADVSALRRLATDAGIAAEELEKRLVKALTKASIAGLGAWREAMPVFTGEGVNSILAKGVTTKPGADAIVYTDTLFSTTPQVIVADVGREPGATPPPLGPIHRWVELSVRRGEFDVSWTGDEGDEAILTAALKLQAAIGARGLPAGHQPGRAAILAQKVLNAEIADAAADFQRRIT